MALKIPKLRMPTDAKSRIVILFTGVAVFFLAIYFIVYYFHGSENATTGPSKVANAPSELKSIPGSTLSPEYSRALNEANQQAAQQAQITGTSAVPTLINVPSQIASTTGNCTVLCPNPDQVTIVDDINDLVKSGKMPQAVANALIDLAKKNVSVDEYASALDELVRQGKITPEQARMLLEKYKKQHADALLNESAKEMDKMIKSGGLSLTTANALLDAQKQDLTPSEYADQLQALVRQGKISQQNANALVAQYARQHQQEAVKKGNFTITQMAKSGQITPDVAKTLTELQNKNVPLDQYAAQLNQLVKEGKMTPEASVKLLALYKSAREAGQVTTCLQPLLTKGPEGIAQFNRLIALQSNNAVLSQYTDELKRGVQVGIISPDMAACALQQYQGITSAAVAIVQGNTPTIDTNIPGAKEFAALQQRVQSQTQTTTQPSEIPPGQTPEQTAQFLAAQKQEQVDAEQARQQRIQAIQGAMSTQAQSLLTAWQAPVMVHVAAAPEEDKTKTGNAASENGKSSSSTSSTKGESTEAAPKASIIKAGTIYFAVLDTAVDSDYPDTPVMATIVQGPYKGAKLLGKLSLAQGKDKVSLNFTSMDMDAWLQTKDISAFAIDPDTARTVLASNVDYHYMKRYGAMMAAAFVQGYSSAITQAGTSTTGIFGTSTSHPELSPTDKIAVGIGQVGTTMGQAISSYINTPTTVKVNSGVGIGILFASAVTE